MKAPFLLLLSVLILNIMACSQKISPPAYAYQAKSIEYFFDKQFNFETVRTEVIQNCEKAHRALVSFVVTKEGAIDSIFVCEKTSDNLAKEIVRVLSLTQYNWTPKRVNGVARISERIFWPIYISCIDGQSWQQDINYFRNYDYKKLPGWDSRSIIYKITGLGVSSVR